MIYVYEGEWTTVFSSAVCRLFPIERKTWRSFPFLFSDLKSTEEGRNAACRKYKPGSYLAEDCRMPQFLHLYHQGRGHSPCHHQLQWSSESGHGNVRILLLQFMYLYSILYHFRYLKSEEIELLIAFICCCFDAWVMGQSCPKVNFTFQICELSWRPRIKIKLTKKINSLRFQ